MRWEIFCRVIDNHGDLGVGWRLAVQLADRGDPARLWVDDPAALAWMAPAGHPGVEIRRWQSAAPPSLGDVVIEAFACELPTAVVDAMAAQPRPPIWINLEYLSAEPWVERAHGLPSPVRAGVGKWFFHPGFTAATGGLLRGTAGVQVPTAARRQAWFSARGVRPLPGERIASLFCYPHADLARWLRWFGAVPTLLLATPPTADALRCLPAPAAVRVVRLPWLEQTEYDQLLGCCDLNVVRGEDSFVQAHWAGAPLLWHIYPQSDGVHRGKLDAWVDRLIEGAEPALARDIRRMQHAWNGFADPPAAPPEFAAWQSVHEGFRRRLMQQPDLVTQLRHFAMSRMPRSGARC